MVATSHRSLVTGNAAQLLVHGKLLEVVAVCNKQSVATPELQQHLPELRQPQAVE